MKIHRFHLVDVGRDKANREFDAGYSDEDRILSEIGQHLASSNISVEWDESDVVGTIYAGFYSVGKIYDKGPVPEPELP